MKPEQPFFHKPTILLYFEEYHSVNGPHSTILGHSCLMTCVSKTQTHLSHDIAMSSWLICTGNVTQVKLKVSTYLSVLGCQVLTSLGTEWLVKSFNIHPYFTLQMHLSEGPLSISSIKLSFICGLFMTTALFFHKHSINALHSNDSLTKTRKVSWENIYKLLLLCFSS